MPIGDRPYSVDDVSLVELYRAERVENDVRKFLRDTFDSDYIEKYDHEVFLGKSETPLLSISVNGELGTEQLFGEDITMEALEGMLEV